MPSDTKTRTILLADLVGSTTQMTRLEAERGANFIHDATRPIKDATEENDGLVVKFTGDGYLCTFESANDALAAAEDIRSFFMRQRHTPTGIALDGVRLVVHTADIVIEENDIVGDGVIIVSRLEKNVPTNAIWVTAATREVCSDAAFNFEEVGEVKLRGRSRPVFCYALQSAELRYLENNIALVITDLHRYIEAGESLSPLELNDWLLRWGNLHREATKGLKGWVRQFVADMALLTFADPDEAFHAILNLRALTEVQNRRDDLPNFSFKGAIGFGDLILSPNGIVGPLVNETFDVLNETPRNHIGFSEGAFQQLSDFYKEQVKLEDEQYRLPLESAEKKKED